MNDQDKIMFEKLGIWALRSYLFGLIFAVIIYYSGKADSLMQRPFLRFQFVVVIVIIAGLTVFGGSKK